MPIRVQNYTANGYFSAMIAAAAKAHKVVNERTRIILRTVVPTLPAGGSLINSRSYVGDIHK